MNKRIILNGRGIFSLLLTIALAFGCAGIVACSGESSQAEETETVQQASEEKGTLSFTVEKGDWNDSSADSVVILVTGKNADGESVNDKFETSFDQKYNLEYGAGAYIFALASESSANGDMIYKGSATVDFDGKADQKVVVRIEKDTDAMNAAAEAKAAEEKEAAEKKAAEEAAAQKAAEEQAAAQEAAAQAEAARATAAEQTNGAMVYIASSGKGKKFHSTPTCSNMKSATELTQSEAESKGYTPCSKCW